MRLREMSGEGTGAGGGEVGEAPLVAVVMGSTSDWETMRHAADVLKDFGVAHECRVVSAHRTPAWMAEFAAGAEARGLEVIIAGAGGAAPLPGMVADQQHVLGAAPDPLDEQVALLVALAVRVVGRVAHDLDQVARVLALPVEEVRGDLAVLAVRVTGRLPVLLVLTRALRVVE